MDKKYIIGILIAILLIVVVFSYVFIGSGSSNSSKSHYDDKNVSFDYPKNWQTFYYFWPANFGFQYKADHDEALNADEITGVLDPKSNTATEKFTTSVRIEIKEIPSGSSLKQVFDETYNKYNQSTVISISEKNITVDGQTAYEKTYKKPHGEPWFQIRDVWLEKNGTIYIISCRALPQNFDNAQKDFDIIINSFHVK